MQLSGYRSMWVVTMFDLPTDTKESRRDYTHFRKMLLEDGFTQTQYSIYSRHCASEENAAVHIQRVERNVPPDGEVRILTVTDRQFERQRIFWGKMRMSPSVTPQQLELF